MREIKFRAWDEKENKMYDKYAVDEDGFAVNISLDEHINRPDLILQQYTGLKDKNGLTDIYEDDIIDTEGQVIGNKYQNYELLKEPTNFLIQGLGTEIWETTNKEAMGRGCQYSKYDAN